MFMKYKNTLYNLKNVYKIREGGHGMAGFSCGVTFYTTSGDYFIDTNTTEEAKEVFNKICDEVSQEFNYFEIKPK